MNLLPTTDQKLEELVRQRKLLLIGEWEFQQGKRQLLEEPDESRSHYVRDVLIAAAIGIVALVWLAIEFPNQAKSVLEGIRTLPSHERRSVFDSFSRVENATDKLVEGWAAQVRR